MNEQNESREHIEILWTLILLTVFLGQVDIRPFSNLFRFSLSVPSLSLILLYFPSASPVIYSAVAGLVMLVFRVGIAAASQNAPALEALFIQHFPGLIFYLTFGLLFSFFKVQERTSRGLTLFFLLLICEVLANLAELTCVHLLKPQPLEKAVYFVVLFGVLRSCTTAAVYRLTIYWQERHDRKQQEERYRRMLLFFSNIKTDLLFFRKSMDDIETAMKYSYSLYEKLKGGRLGEEALSVSRRIHEVKKEYQRIIASMEKALSGEYIEQPLRLSEIFALLQASTESLLAAKNEKIEVSFRCDDDWLIGPDYKMISIINNLVINSVEAMSGGPEGGRIEVVSHLEGDNYLIEVADNGPGIPEDLLDCIFEPGFSTKFDPRTGAMSTGIGLVHVKNIVETHSGGRIQVESGPDGARFRISLPVERNKDGTEIES
ncbi:hypothetical protein C4J81_14440 [Deltaproteobacteria bacterium Smac51]|nr:hypothetical protein C4J81_14440 [Deltaproteobacteria bacterium Smac51]